MMGHGERIDLFESDTIHGFPKSQREATLRWIRRWLLNKDDALVETEMSILKEQDLWCTRTGQVLEDLKGASTFDLNAARANTLEAQRSKAPLDVAALKQQMRSLLNIQLPCKAATCEEKGKIRRDGYEIVKFSFTTEPGIAVPGLLFRKDTKDHQPLVLYLHGRGKTVDALPGGRIEKHLRNGRRVLALDLRGFGETSPNATTAMPKTGSFGAEYKEAFIAMHLNRPLLG